MKKSELTKLTKLIKECHQEILEENILKEKNTKKALMLLNRINDVTKKIAKNHNIQLSNIKENKSMKKSDLIKLIKECHVELLKESNEIKMNPHDKKLIAITKQIGEDVKKFKTKYDTKRR